MKLQRWRNSRRIAFSVSAVIRAVGGNIFALRGLRELPNVREADAAFGGTWRRFRKSAAGRGRTRVIDRPVDDVVCGAGALARVGANIFGGDDVVVIGRWDAGAVDARAESSGGNAIDPRVNVGFLLGQHASALLLVEEDDGVRGKAFAARGSGGGLCVGVAELACVGDGFQFGVEASVEEHEKTEARGFDGGAVSGPGVRFFAGRIVEPVAGVGESLVQGFEIGVAGVGVAVEAEVGDGLKLRARLGNGD